MQIVPLVNAATQLGEGPLWEASERRLYFIDSLGNRVLSCGPDGEDLAEWPVPHNIGSMALRAGGGAIVSLADGIYTLDFETGKAELLRAVDHGGPDIRLNDGKADAAGRFVVGSMNVTEARPDGRLYSVSSAGDITVLDDGITVSNGPCWSPDHSIFYFADSRAKCIYRYAYDTATGRVSDKAVFARFDESDGLPDGATVDAEGCVWSAGVYKGKIHRFAPTGERLATIDMPVLSVTSLMFGGDSLDRLYVTTMASPPVPGVHETSELAGWVLAIDGLGVTGLPEYRFAG